VGYDRSLVLPHADAPLRPTVADQASGCGSNSGMAERRAARRGDEQQASYADENARRTDLVVLRGYVLLRLAGLLQAAVSIAVWSRADHRPWLTAGTAALVVVGSAVTALVGWRAGRVRPAVAVSEVMVVGALLVITARFAAPGGMHPWTFLWPLSFTVLGGACLAFHRFSRALALTALLGAAYTGATLLYRPGVNINIPQDLMTYLGMGVVAWVLPWELRRLSHRLDAARRRELDRQVELAAERERTRHYRDLHDHVLQTLETLARGTFVTDQRVQHQIAREAQWLRRLVEGQMPADGDPGQAGDLAGALAEVVDARTADGLRVDLHTAALHEPLPPPVTRAAAAAVGEALTNVRKHSGVAHAVVRAVPERGGALISVLDQGRGFDPGAPAGRPGIGLRESIHGRLAQVGGRATVESAPGAGTYVELWVPGAGAAPGPEREGRAGPSGAPVGEPAGAPVGEPAGARPATVAAAGDEGG
jgi:signal transduction histidine kinase